MKNHCFYMNRRSNFYHLLILILTSRKCETARNGLFVELFFRRTLGVATHPEIKTFLERGVSVGVGFELGRRLE